MSHSARAGAATAAAGLLSLAATNVLPVLLALCTSVVLAVAAVHALIPSAPRERTAPHA